MKKNINNYYKLLNVIEIASANEIDLAYIEIIKNQSDDKVLTETEINEIIKAYKILSNENLRAKYDLEQKKIATTISDEQKNTVASSLFSKQYTQKSSFFDGFWELAIISTLMIVFFPWSLLFTTVFFGFDTTKDIIKIMLIDGIRTIFSILSIVLIIFLLILIIFSFF